MENFKTADIIKFILPQWKRLLMVAIISVVFGYGITYLLKPLYKSYAIVYPVNLSPSSEESNTEQLLQWFNSEEVKKTLNKKFNLYEHYRIDTIDPRHETLYNLKYKELVTISATLYESIEISVKDESPEMAQKLVQGIIDATNQLIADVRKERLLEYIANNKNQVEKDFKPMDSLKMLITDYRKNYNIVDVAYQAKLILKKENKNKSLSDQEHKTLDFIRTKEKDYHIITSNYEIIQGAYNYHKSEVKKFSFDYDSKVSYTNVVSKPTLPDAKCYPIRSLIAVIISISTVLLAFIYIVVVTNYKNQKVD